MKFLIFLFAFTSTAMAAPYSCKPTIVFAEQSKMRASLFTFDYVTGSFFSELRKVEFTTQGSSSPDEIGPERTGFYNLTSSSGTKEFMEFRLGNPLDGDITVVVSKENFEDIKTLSLTQTLRGVTQRSLVMECQSI